MCAKPGCKETVRRYLDTEDATSTGNLSTHAVACWGAEIVCAAKATGNPAKARPMVEKFGRTGTITKMFERIGKGKVSYSTRQHTSTEARYVPSDILACSADLMEDDRAWIVRWVAENKRPYEIVRDRAFLQLMKTGRPEYKIPSPSTVSRDVRRVFARCRARIAKMLQVRV